MTTTQSVAVIGDAHRATGLADLFARYGFDVQVISPSEDELPALAVDLLIEVVAEEDKSDVLRAMSKAALAESILVTTTSTQSVTELATAVSDPAQLVGLHWGHEGIAAALVEVVAAEQTDTALVEEVGKVAERLERGSVVVKDNPGFLVDWLFLPYLNDVVQAYDDELATADDIDIAVKLGLGYRKGPFQMLEEIGVQRHLAATTAAYEATHDGRFAPPPLLCRLGTGQPAPRHASTPDPAEKEGNKA
ncbi:3-hydroxyacyl-CoA dehydrogenase NAD-binding domain-containing protein [Rhodococcus koreensis]|uniref:3-hydroxyacyl-CoA dehydrogenase NAD-binding domain-containing protein n=1 Tax=Rhodococcus koreensis TaxID=99653 RepID=UPI001428D4E3|nr:3-hydroxyacyl-CoA dehydrogenase NAD-binding domain-containing protein [Rhodococcus koreensis]